MKKKENKSNKSENRIKINGKKIRFLSPDSSVYKNNSIIMLFRGSRVAKPEEKQNSKFENFLSRAPISFDNEEEV